MQLNVIIEVNRRAEAMNKSVCQAVFNGAAGVNELGYDVIFEEASADVPLCRN
jgi:hypothetical protein